MWQKQPRVGSKYIASTSEGVNEKAEHMPTHYTRFMEVYTSTYMVISRKI